MRRPFCSYIALIGLLIVLSIVGLAYISKSLSFLSQMEWLPGAGEVEKRNTLTFTIPWDGGNALGHNHLIEETVSTPTSTAIPTTSISGSLATMYSNYDYEPLPPTTTTSSSYPTSPSSGNAYMSSPSITSTETDDADCTDTGAASATPCRNCLAKGVDSGSTSPNMTGDMPFFATPMGYICRPQFVTTQPAMGCSVCTTVTETWHSTCYDCTSTTIISVAAMTATVTVTPTSLPSSTVTVTPPSLPSSTTEIDSSLGSTAPISTVSTSTDTALNHTSVNSTLFYTPCPSSSPPVQGPPPQTISTSTFPFLNSTPSLHNLFPNLQTNLLPNLQTGTAAVTTSAAHPCPNAGYSCSECPGGWFCPPLPTPAMSCPCGWGWACAHCVGGWYCVPGPTSTVPMSTSSTSGILAGATSPVVGSLITTLSRIGDTVTPVVGDISSVVEHITADKASTPPSIFGTTVPPTPALTSDTISIITTAVPVAPLILPDPNDAGSRKMKRRAWQGKDNLGLGEDYAGQERGR